MDEPSRPTDPAAGPQAPGNDPPRWSARMKAQSRAQAANRRLMMQVSKRYYLDGLTKVQIAEELGLSRFKVARVLADAHEAGMVSITLNSGAPLPALSEEVARHLGLRGVHVVEVYGDEENVRAAVGRTSGTYLRDVLQDGDVLGIGWGRTLNAMFDNLDHLPQIEIMQLSGRFLGDAHDSATQLTRRTVALAGGAVSAIPAPFFIDDARQANALRRQPEVASVVAGFNRLTTAVVGVGAVYPRPISVAYSQVPERFTAQVLHSGAVGEVQGNLFAEDGRAVEPRLWRHTLNITPDQLRRVDRVVAAAADPVKARAVRAVCASGVVTDLVVDVELANALLRLAPTSAAAARSASRFTRTGSRPSPH